MTIKALIKYAIKNLEYKIEESIIITLKKVMRNQHGNDSYIGVLGVGKSKEGYYIRGPWETFISNKVENPGIHARHFIKNALAPVIGPAPPDKGKCHKIVLIPLPSFIIKTSLYNQRKFFHDWEATVESFGLPWCELTTWR